MLKILSIIRPSSLNYVKKINRRYFCLTRILFKHEIEDDRPIKFSSSPASKYKAKTTRTGVDEPRLWYEPYVIFTSISVFMIYFLILREENDIDRGLERTLYSRIEGLEEFQLRQVLEYNEAHGKDSKDIIMRLKEIEAEKQELENYIEK